MCQLYVSTDAEYLPHLVNEWPLLHLCLKFVSMYDEDLQKKRKKAQG